MFQLIQNKRIYKGQFIIIPIYYYIINMSSNLIKTPQVTGIIYSLIARTDKTVLVSQTQYKGNFPVIALDVLQRINKSKTFSQFITQNYVFYVYVFEGFVYLAMTDPDYKLRLAVGFLKTIQKKFYQKYNQNIRSTSISFSLKTFAKTLQETMDTYTNNKQKIDRLTQLQTQLSQLEKISLQNMDKIIQRSEKIEVLMAKSQALSTQSYGLKQSGVELNRAMWWKNKKVMIGIGAVVVIIIIIVVVVVIKSGN